MRKEGGEEVITAERRYWNAMRKAELLRNREIRKFNAGKVDVLDADKFEKICLIEAINRAYQDGKKEKA